MLAIAASAGPCVNQLTVGMTAFGYFASASHQGVGCARQDRYPVGLRPLGATLEQHRKARPCPGTSLKITEVCHIQDRRMALVENNATGRKRCIRIRRGHKRAQEALASVAAAVSQNIPVGTRAGILIGDEHCAGGENQATWPIHLPLPEATKIAKCLRSRSEDSQAHWDMRSWAMALGDKPVVFENIHDR